MQLVDDGLGRAGRHQDALPGAGDGLREARLARWSARRGWPATRSLAVTASALSRPPFTCGMAEAMVPNIISTWPPTMSVDRRPGAALVGHVRHVEPGTCGTAPSPAGPCCPTAGRGEVDLAGLRLGILDQLLDAVGRKLRVGDQQARACRRRIDTGMKSLLRLDAQVLEQCGLIAIVPTLPRKSV